MAFTDTLPLASGILACVLALIVAMRGWRSIADWSSVVGLAFLATECLFSWLSAGAILPSGAIYWQNWRLVALSFLPAVWLFFSLTYARGNWREFIWKWRLVLVAMFIIPTALAICFDQGLIASIQPVRSGNTWVLGLGRVGVLLNFIFLLAAVLVLMNIERTFRASVGTMRWRIKFTILGLGVLFAVRAYTSSQTLLFSAIDLSLESVNCVALMVACLLITCSLVRTGQFDVKVYPSHSVLHNSLTALLAGIYLVIVGLLAKLVTFLGDDSSFTVKAFVILVALVALTMLLMSDRVRLRTRQFVSRHFRRPLYDYRLVWKRFTQDTVSRMEQTDLCREVVRLVAEIFQALSVTLWLVDDKGKKVTAAASTSLPQIGGGSLRLQHAEATELIQALHNRVDPVDFEESNEYWAAVLRRYHPDKFHKGGGRVAVPIINGANLLGVMTLCDRVSGVPFSQQDYDLLKCVGDQVAASLRNIQLSERLLQAKELETFQTISAFFIHDLKNTASTLNLMLQNVPVHFDDPEFRKDTLNGISKTVDHMNRLIGQLGLLRQELEVRPTKSDLNRVVSQALALWEKRADVALAKDLHPLPKVSLDDEQMLKVVTNLVLNAEEAVSGKGHIHVETNQHNGWVVLAVADDGCGMSEEFLQRSLFRPFQSTKKKGLGIGMFQSKMIVEAHGGRIEVESERGKGSTFRVLLPVQPQAL
jgi:putative PEP-CTERM system histidine kinase